MKTIIIDAGHGGSDPGASFNGNFEKNFNLVIAQKVRDYLKENYNVNIIMTRTGDQTFSLTQRSTIANLAKPDFFLSIHHNAGGGTGFESFIYNGIVSSQTQSYQKAIHADVLAGIQTSYGVKDRGIKQANFHVLRETKMPALLLEILFIDNEKDLLLMKNETFRKDVSRSIATGVANALSLQKISSATRPLFKVIAGSFKNRRNAEIRVKALKQHNHETIILPIVISGQQYYRVEVGAYEDSKNAENKVAVLKKIGISAFILKNSSETPPPLPPPSGENLQSILGDINLLPSQLDSYVQTINPNAPLFGELYVDIGEHYGIRGDIAYAQAIHETNYFRFTGDVQADQNNYAGIGATGQGAQGAIFDSPEQGVLAHIQHLYAYASSEQLPLGYPLVDPRFSLVTRGIAPYWSYLNGKWAVPGTNYGQLILSIYETMIQFSIKRLNEQKVNLEDLLKEL
ncbi:N-acetylmuramoyl-L-alanine amidase [Bacillus sp. 2205SS5-2]|uniref:N-acetylmuramoyl-L-alanine amidase n=1 Tax=Bacillus sp. 2205SS5-2 TaxID=3109031 RepID=UPI00300595C7